MSPILNSRRIQIYIIGAITALGFVLRIYMSNYSLFGDEFFTLQMSNSSFQGLIHDLKMDLHPPLFFYLVKIISTWISGEIGLRLVSILAGSMAVIGMYLFCRQIFSKRAGVIAAVMTALSPLAISYSQEARQYSLLFCITIWSSYYIFRWITHKNKFDFIGFILLSVIGFYTHYFYLLTFIVHFVWFWTVVRSPGLKKNLLFGSLFIAVCFLPWIIEALPTQLAFKLTVERPRGGILFLGKQFAEMSVGHSFFHIESLTESREPLYSDILANLVPSILVFGSYGYLLILGFLQLRRIQGYAKYILLSLLIIPIIIISFLNYFSIGSFLSTKYVIASLFPFLILLSLGIEASFIERRILNIGVIILMIVLSLLSLKRYYFDRDMYGRWENWKDCYAYIHNNYPTNKSTTILLPDDDKRQISYYLPDYLKYDVVCLQSRKYEENKTDLFENLATKKSILVLSTRKTMSDYQEYQFIVKNLKTKFDAQSELVFGKRLSLSILKRVMITLKNTNLY